MGNLEPEGSMVEGCIVYDSFYYASEYTMQIDDTLGEVDWKEQLDEDKREGELSQMNGKRCMRKSKPLIFCQIICTEKLYTLKLVIYIWYHIICIEYIYIYIYIYICQWMQKLIPSINLFFTMWRSHNHGRHCMKREERNVIVTRKHLNGWMVEAWHIMII